MYSEDGTTFVKYSTENDKDFTFNTLTGVIDTNGNFVKLEDEKGVVGSIRGIAKVESREEIMLKGTKESSSEFIKHLGKYAQPPNDLDFIVHGDTCIGTQCKPDDKTSWINIYEEELYSTNFIRGRGFVNNPLVVYIQAQGNNEIEVHRHDFRDILQEKYNDYRKKHDIPYEFSSESSYSDIYSRRIKTLIAPIEDDSSVDYYIDQVIRDGSIDVEGYPDDGHFNVIQNQLKFKFSKDMPLQQGIYDLNYGENNIIGHLSQKEDELQPWIFYEGKVYSEKELGTIDLNDKQEHNYEFLQEIDNPDLRTTATQMMKEFDEDHLVRGISPLTYYLTKAIPTKILDSLTGGFGRSAKCFVHYMYGSGEPLTVDLTDDEWNFIIDQTINKKDEWKEGTDGWERMGGIRAGLSPTDSSRFEEGRVLQDSWNIFGTTTLARRKIDRGYEYRIEEGNFDFIGSTFTGFDYHRYLPSYAAKAIQKFEPGLVTIYDKPDKIAPSQSNKEYHTKMIQEGYVGVQFKANDIEYLGKPFPIDAGNSRQMENRK